MRKRGGRSSSPDFRLPGTGTGGGLRVRCALPRPQPATFPGGLQLAVEERKLKEAGNPEVLLSRGLGDSFEWNRADSSPVLRSRSLLSVRRCLRRRVATRPGRMQTATSLQAASAEPEAGLGRPGVCLARPSQALGFPESRCPARLLVESGPDGERGPLGPLFPQLRVSGRVRSGCHLLANVSASP